MDTRAYLKGSRLSPQKAGLVANEIRGKSVQDAMDFLTFSKQKAAYVIKKLLESAIANAENNNKLDIDTLEVKSIMVNQGMRLKRMRPRARGRADRIIKPTCHIEIILSDQEK
jgi:large subunit ribosomal protein L22|tara:strand:- start:41 stop:379 length:339 start_codon:yes stop_codon:yes gene_type:complete